MVLETQGFQTQIPIVLVCSLTENLLSFVLQTWVLLGTLHLSGGSEGKGTCWTVSRAHGGRRKTATSILISTL